MKPAKILIADDHEMIRRGLRTVIEEQPGWSICGEAITGRQAVDMARKLQPDLIILFDFAFNMRLNVQYLSHGKTKKNR